MVLLPRPRCARCALEITLTNAGATTYPNGWRDYRACASYDRVHWFRVPTRYVDGTLLISHRSERSSIYFAYFEPYLWERHLRLLAELEATGAAAISPLASTADGRDLDVVTLGSAGSARADAKKVAKKVWIIARQHPGESMAEWFAEGFMRRLVDRYDAVARRVLERCVVRVVPNMNPDGSVRGNLRASGTGANLNREWLNPTLERSPEVLAVRDCIHATGVDFFLDVHGDEALPYVFVAGAEMLPHFTAAQRLEQQRFCAAFERASPDFQTKHGYPSGSFSADSLKLASKYVADRFGCLSLTLEMPFKDNANLPDEKYGWNGARSARLGAALVQAIAEWAESSGE